MKTIKELLDEVIDLEGKVQISQAIDFHKGVPTLEKRRNHPTTEP